MLPVSEAFRELMKNNIRPKCEPKITISGVDNTGKEIHLEWKASNITGLTFHRSIDPASRELPCMELTWQELYFEKLTKLAYPEKYNNVLKNMKVELKFTQNLDLVTTWKKIKDSGYTWKDIKKMTWRQVLRDFGQETVTFPNLFLTDRPTIDGHIITWKARDIMSLLNERQTFVMGSPTISGIKWKAPMQFALLNSRSPYLKNKDVFDGITKSASELSINWDLYAQRIIFDDVTSNILMNHAATRNFYFDFEKNYLKAKLINFQSLQPVAEFSSQVIREFPVITNGLDISAFRFVSSYVNILPDTYTVERKTRLSTEGYQPALGQFTIADYSFNGYALPQESIDYVGLTSGMDLYTFEDTSPDPLNLQKMEKVDIEQTVFFYRSGEEYNERNPLALYLLSNPKYYGDYRLDFLGHYFSKKQCSLQWDGLADISLETGDIVTVVTNLYENGENIKKKAIIVDIELTYNGVLKEKYIAHEVL